MSGELEAAGAAATAGLVAAAVERKGGPGAVGEGACLNCGTRLDGAYCHTCGQPAHISRKLLEVFHDFLHAFMHFDAKAWRTLPMLVARPGTLTARYIHGARARFVSPLAMFLFTIFVMFFVFSLAGGPNIGRVPAGDGRARPLAEASVSLGEAQSGIAKDAPRVARAVGDARHAVDAARANRGGAAAEGRWQDRLREEVDSGEMKVNTGYPALDRRILSQLRNPDLALYKLQEVAYKYSFLLVPISLPFIALLFLFKRGVTLFDHAVFSLYSLSFMSLLFILIALIARAGEWTEAVIAPLVLTTPPAHMYFHLKGTYGLGWFGALWRTVLLLAMTLVALVVFLAAVLVLGLFA